MIRRKFLKAMALSASGLLLPISYSHAKSRARVTDMRFWSAPDHTRIVFDLDRKIAHSLRHMSKQDRMVVDLVDAQWDFDPTRLRVEDSVVGNFHLSTPSPGLVRLEFKLKTGVIPNSFFLKPVSGRDPRLVVDLQREDAIETDLDQREVRLMPKTRPSIKHKRDAIIVIDPGHGGEDPGAVGTEGTYEKSVTLEVARKFSRELNRINGFKAYLTRSDDYFVSLRQRVSIARKHDADLFISLHADAYKTSAARGASVYCLSEKGKPAPNRAIRTLVQRENSADLIGGVDLGLVSDSEVRGILMDLSQRDSLNRALAYGSNILSYLKKVPTLKMHFSDIKQAGFAVLKAPDIPSVLVEMAFLSNRDEELMLRRKDHQESLAEALTNGTKKFLHSSQLA